MDYSILLGLRPTDKSSVAISAAIERARIVLADADEAAAVAQREHDDALLDAPPERLQVLAQKLGKVRQDGSDLREHVAAIVRQLEARLSAAKHDEAQLQVTSARSEAEDAGRALASWWSEKRPLLAELLREGERLDTALDARIGAFKSVVASVGRAYEDIDLRYPDPTASSAFNWRDAVETMSHPVRAPHVLVPPTASDRERAEAEERYRRDPHPEGFNPVLLRRA